MGITVGSLGPKMGAERREQVAKERSGLEAERTRFSARVCWLLVSGFGSALGSILSRLSVQP